MLLTVIISVACSGSTGGSVDYARHQFRRIQTRAHVRCEPSFTQASERYAKQTTLLRPSAVGHCCSYTMGLLRLSSVVFPLLVGGEAFIASPPPLSALQQQRSTLQPATTTTVNAASLAHPSRREQQLQPPTLLPLAVLLHPRSTRAMRKRSSNTVLFAREGEPMGPGTQQLSRQAKLAISILIDLIGMSSYALPGVGEVSPHALPWGTKALGASQGSRRPYVVFSC